MSHESNRRPARPHGTSVVEVLLELRARAQGGKTFQELLGAGRIEEMVAFEAGYRACCWANGFGDTEGPVFWAWLRSKGEYDGDWTARLLSACGGDHEKAMSRLLDFMAEYMALRERQPLECFPPPLQVLPDKTPRATPVRYVSVIDEWMRLYPEIKRGRPLWFFFGYETLPTVVCFALGYTRCCERHGFPDMRWQAFLRWLCEVEHLPLEHWGPQLLERRGMEHESAIYRLLDRVAEFVRQPSTPGV